MSKIIVSKSILGSLWFDVLIREIKILCEELNIDSNNVITQITSAPNFSEANNIIKEKFSNQLIII